MNLEDIKLCEIIQSQKDKQGMIPLTWLSKSLYSWNQSVEWWLAEVRSKAKLLINEHMVSVNQDE